MLPGAVAIVALDQHDNVLMVRQYRHPVARHLWEIPAGLLDSTTETPLEAGSRELFEEGGYRARKWHTLVDVLTSPGMADETIRVLLARDLLPVPEDERHAGVHEEAEMEIEWWPLDEAIARALSGELENGISVAGLLAAHVAAHGGFQGLRPADAVWQARKGGEPAP
jgi:ADP-ribose pyrophosphatase